MAAFNKFNAFAAYPFNGAINLASDTTKVILSNVAPSASNSIYTDITEISGGGTTGYTVGGVATSGNTSTQAGGTYKYVAALANPTWTAGASGFGPFRYAVLYDSSAATKVLIGWWDNGSPSLTLTSGQTFTVTLDATNGVFQSS